MNSYARSVLIAGVLGLTSFCVLAEDCAVKNLDHASAAKAQTFAQQLEHTNPCKVDAGVSAQSLKTVWASFLSDSHTGGKRFDTPPPNGTPTGNVMMPAHGVEFDFSQVATEGLRTFTLDATGTRLFSVKNPQTKFAIPAGKFNRETSYSWELITAQGAYKGQFQLIGVDEQKDVEGRLARLKKANLDPDTYLLYAAAIYDDAGLYSARDKAFFDLDQHIGM